MKILSVRAVTAALLAVGFIATGLGDISNSAAQDKPAYRFAAPLNPENHRVYRVNVSNGEMGICWYGADDGIGITVCQPAGTGGGAQEKGDYSLVASSNVSESSIFRVNNQTGEISICYYWDNSVVCTPPM